MPQHQYRLQLVLYHVADISHSPPPRTISGLISSVNRTYQDLLRNYTEFLLFYGLRGDVRERLRTDADVENFLNSSAGGAPTFEVLLSEEAGAKFMRGMVDELASLRKQAADGWRTGANPAYGLLSRIAVVDDARAAEILRNEPNAGQIISDGMRSSPECPFMQSQGTRGMDLWTTESPDRFQVHGSPYARISSSYESIRVGTAPRPSPCQQTRVWCKDRGAGAQTSFRRKFRHAPSSARPPRTPSAAASTPRYTRSSSARPPWRGRLPRTWNV